MTDAPNCPFCQGRLRPIVYSLPGPDLFDRADRGEVQLGGCVITPDAPDFVCETCGVEWSADLVPLGVVTGEWRP